MMQTLVEKAVQGNVEAFLELMEQNSLTMYKIARAILNNDNDAADAVQDTILNCFEKIHTLKNQAYFKTWLIRILINNCNRILRHYKRTNLPGDIPETICKDPSLEEFEFKEMLNLMDTKYRLVLILYYLEELNIPEIAELLDINENTVKTRLARAREKIRTAYFES